MKHLTCIESFIDKNSNHFGSFLIEPLEIGQGITLGNALRRTLLSDLSGFAITGVKINNLKHEFSVVEGLREDILEIILNLKEIIFKSSLFNKASATKLSGQLSLKGPIVVTAGMFKLQEDQIKIINPNQYICTILDNSDLQISIDIEKGKGYRLTDDIINQKVEGTFFPLDASTLKVDAIFMPIRKANYKIKLIHDTQGNIKESLQFEILTNGSITPKRGMQEALKILIKILYPLLNSSNFLDVSSQLATNYLN